MDKTDWITTEQAQRDHDIPPYTVYRWARTLSMAGLARKVGRSAIGQGGGLWLLSPLAVKFLKSRKGKVGNPDWQRESELNGKIRQAVRDGRIDDKKC